MATELQNAQRKWRLRLGQVGASHAMLRNIIESSPLGNLGRASLLDQLAVLTNECTNLVDKEFHQAQTIYPKKERKKNDPS